MGSASGRVGDVGSDARARGGGGVAATRSDETGRFGEDS